MTPPRNRGGGHVALALVTLATTALPAALHGQEQVRDFLVDRVGFSHKDVRKMEEGGEVIVRLLDTNDPREVATFGAFRATPPSPSVIGVVRAVESYLPGAGMTAVGRVSDPPVLADFTDISFPQEDVEAIHECRVGSCKVKLAGWVLERLQDEVDWDSGDHAEHAEEAHRLAHELMLEYARRYLAEGNAALGSYDDKEETLTVLAGFQALLTSSPYLIDYAPEFHAYLANFPHGSLDGVQDFLYWSVEDFGLKPVVALNHMSVYDRGADQIPRYFIASKQIYATHYFQASLSLAALVSFERDGLDTGTYVLQLGHHRFDGEVGGLRRRMLRGKLGDHVKEQLAGQRRKVEAGARGRR